MNQEGSQKRFGNCKYSKIYTVVGQPSIVGSLGAFAKVAIGRNNKQMLQKLLGSYKLIPGITQWLQYTVHLCCGPLGLDTIHQPHPHFSPFERVSLRKKDALLCSNGQQHM